MADHAHSSAAPNVPADLIARSQKGWDFFTKATVAGCAAVAATLLMMLLVFKIL
jgi:hypothetical protein